jgi:hypothetical protein
MYAFYEFLERLGCRWYTPDWARIPKRASIDLAGFDESTSPELEYRELYSGPSKDKGLGGPHYRVNGHFLRVGRKHGW